MHIKFTQAVLFVTELVPTRNRKIGSSFPSSRLMCVGERVDMTRVWCLVAEGDYVRIKVSLCLWHSETEVKDNTSC